MYNYNIAKPKVYEVDKTIRSLKEFRSINGQNYITLSAADGRKLMQRLKKPGTGTIDRVLASGQDDEQQLDEVPDFILIESKDYARDKSSSKICGQGYLHKQLETSKLELNSIQFYQALLAEFIGVYILTLVVCGVGISLNAGEKIPSIHGALAGGLTLGTMIWCTNCMSGGNLNPAISIALVITNDLVLIRGIFYIVFQLLGAYAGAASITFLMPQSQRSQLGLTLLNSNVSLGKGFGVELIITFLLALTIYASIDKNRKDLNGSVPLSIGLSVTCGALFGGPYTGGSMNPARSFGPAAVQNIWTHHWLYWIGPITGAVCAGIVYKLFGVKVGGKKKDSESD